MLVAAKRQWAVARAIHVGCLTQMTCLADSHDHVLEVRSSCEGSPGSCAAYMCLMEVAEVLLHQANATAIRMAVPEGDQVCKLRLPVVNQRTC